MRTQTQSENSHPEINSCLRELQTICITDRDEHGQLPTKGDRTTPTIDEEGMEAVMVLRGLCSASLPDEFLYYVAYVKFGSNIAAAASYIMDTPDLEAEYEAWKLAEQKSESERKKAELDEQQTRKYILDK